MPSLRIRWGAALPFALAIPIFVALGLWQLDRADQKRQLAQELEQRVALPPEMLGAVLVDAEAMRWRRVEAVGTFEPARQILIDHRRQAGRTGFHVITPLRIGGSQTRVLVNRGWIPADSAGQPTDAPVPSGELRVSGEGYLPSAPAIVLGDGDTAAWGTRWPYLTVGLFAGGVDYPVQPIVILQNPSDPHGFERAWTREPPKEGMHLGYAIQWFAFALIALALSLRLGLTRKVSA
jgi:surfeit locus 1 family protein